MNMISAHFWDSQTLCADKHTHVHGTHTPHYTQARARAIHTTHLTHAHTHTHTHCVWSKSLVYHIMVTPIPPSDVVYVTSLIICVNFTNIMLL